MDAERAPSVENDVNEESEATPPNTSPSDSVSPAVAGAFGHDGRASIDLWNAIAPCWYRIADSAAVPAILKISFDANGGLALPPEIERDPSVPITDQSLKAEAQALQALAECGSYPMAQGQQGVLVQFPTPGKKNEIQQTSAVATLH
jgi:hypothetical protein